MKTTKYKIRPIKRVVDYIDPGNRNYDFSEVEYTYAIFEEDIIVKTFSSLEDAEEYLKRLGKS